MSRQERMEAKNLFGFLMPDYLSEAVPAWKGRIQSVSCANEWILEQSDCAFIDVVLEQSDREGCTQTTHLQLFCKQMNVVRLRHRFPSKGIERWTVSVQSFHNEAQFYKSMSGRATSSLPIPKTYFVDVKRVGDDEIDMQFTILMERFPSQFYQSLVLSPIHIASSIRLLASFHAHFWKPKIGADPHAALRQTLFKQGCWWRKELRPHVKFETIPRVWKHVCTAFDMTDLLNDESVMLMQLLSSNIDTVATATSMFSSTIVHGDFKTANILFPGVDGQSDAAATFDFQWTGSASCASDLVYLIWSGIDAAAVASPEAEADILRQYFDDLSLRIPQVAADSTFTWDQFIQEYEIEFLDYWKTALPQLMPCLTPQDADSNRILGNLTFEFDSCALRLICQKAVAVLSKLSKCGFFPTQISLRDERTCL
eukprot:ANDGO_00209.mRNA.1 hypothetical protein PPTG_24467